MVKKFKSFEIVHVLHGENVCANLLEKLSNTKKLGLNRTLIQETLDISSTEV